MTVLHWVTRWVIRLSFIQSVAFDVLSTQPPLLGCVSHCQLPLSPRALYPLHSLLSSMPVQSAFTFVIIGGAFCAASALIGGLNYLYEGKRQRTIGNDHWRHHLQQRDWALEYVLKEKKEKGM